MSKQLKSFLRNTHGATSIEYGMIAMLISIAMLVALTAISGSLEEMYNLILAAF